MLESYHSVSRKEVNFAKSNILFNANVTAEERADMCSMLGVEEMGETY